MKKIFVYTTSEKHRNKDIEAIGKILSGYGFCKTEFEKDNKIFIYSYKEEAVFIIVCGGVKATNEINDLMLTGLQQQKINAEFDNLYLMLHASDFNVSMEQRIDNPGPYKNFGGFKKVNIYAYQHEPIKGSLLWTLKQDYKESSTEFIKKLEDRIIK